MSFSIEVSELWVGDYHNGKLPLHRLDDDQLSHIHGQLCIIVNRRNLPSLGYWGPEDVCLNTWIEEISGLHQWSRQGAEEPYIVDEGEQGQPAFRFERRRKQVLISVVDSLLSGGSGDATFQELSCLLDDVRSACAEFLSTFSEELARTVGEARAARWLSGKAAPTFDTSLANLRSPSSPSKT